MQYYDEIASHIGTAEGQCVLLMGPELSVNRATGQSYKSYYKELADKNKKSVEQYFEYENIFLFKDISGRDAMIEQIKNFYSNTGDDTLLEAIAQIKFPLIINVCPDKSLNRVLEKVYDYTEGQDYIYNYRYSNDYESDEDRKTSLASIPKPTKAKPIIYNIFGDWEVYDSLVYDHKTLFETVQHLLDKDSIPNNIQRFLNKANSFVFLGFDFDSWHYHLMCHKIGLGTNSPKKIYGSLYSNNNNVNKVQVFMKNYFKVNFMDDNPTQTIHTIIKACQKICPQSLRNPTENQHFGVYLSYAWSDKEVDILELIATMVERDVQPDEKIISIKEMIRKSGKEIEEDVDLTWLLEGKKSSNGETIVEWYQNLKSSNQIENNGKLYNREYIVLQVDNILKEHGIQVFRDRNEITYGDSIDSFMNRIGKGKAVIRFVSDKYLRSRFCMDEAIRINKYSNTDNRTFTVVLNENKSLQNVEESIADYYNIEYKKYWGAMIENIYSKIDIGIKNTIDKERVKRNYSIYIDIYDYVIPFIKSIQDEVRLGISTDLQSCLSVNPFDSLSDKEKQELNNFIDVVISKLKQP